jgi:hypothetical protein
MGMLWRIVTLVGYDESQEKTIRYSNSVLRQATKSYPYYWQLRNHSSASGRA